MFLGLSGGMYESLWNHLGGTFDGSVSVSFFPNDGTYAALSSLSASGGSPYILVDMDPLLYQNWYLCHLFWP